MPASVHARRVGSILVIELDSPDGYPRLERSVLSSFDRELESALAPELRGVVVTGTDQAFSVGADLAEVGALGPIEARWFSALGQALMGKIERFPKPVAAAIRGYCFGGGLDLALACHIRVASPDAAFTHPGGSLGIVTGWGGTARLPRLIGRARALELLVTGRKLTAEEALAWGLIQRIVPPKHLLDAALELARQPISRKPSLP